MCFSDLVTFACHPIAGTYVALTLQGPPPSTASLPLEPLSTDHAPNQRASLGGEAPPSPPPPLPFGLSSIPSQRITGPKPLQVSYSTVYYYYHSTSPRIDSLWIALFSKPALKWIEPSAINVSHRTQKFRNTPLRYSGICCSRKKQNCRYKISVASKFYPVTETVNAFYGIIIERQRHFNTRKFTSLSRRQTLSFSAFYIMVFTVFSC